MSGLAGLADQAKAALLNAPILKPQAANNPAATKKAAEDFEAVFLNEILGPMFEGLKTDGPFGGGPGEEMFRSLMIDQYSRAIAHQGGFGLSAAVQRQLVSLQENVQ